MRYGKHGIQNTISTTTGSQGGYVVPQGFSNQLEEAVKWRARSREWLANSKTETGNPMPWPAINDTNNKGRIIGQNAFR
jgi:HK97 family phage major capsid protein